MTVEPISKPQPQQQEYDYIEKLIWFETGTLDLPTEAELLLRAQSLRLPNPKALKSPLLSIRTVNALAKNISTLPKEVLNKKLEMLEKHGIQFPNNENGI